MLRGWVNCGPPTDPVRRSGHIEARIAQIPKLTIRLSFASGGASSSRMDREAQEPHCGCLAGAGIHPLAIGQDRPSRLGPAGEGRADSGVLHLHPRGQARYPEGGRRREDEPPGKGWRVRANTGRRRAPGRRTPGELSTPGLPPRTPRLWARRPCFSTTLRPTRTRQDLPCTSAAEPRTPGH